MVKERRHTSSFEAVSKDGVSHTIHVFTEIIDVGTMDDPNAEAEGLKSLRTADGKAVNRLEKGKYEIPDPFDEILLFSDDPDAP